MNKLSCHQHYFNWVCHGQLEQEISYPGGDNSFVVFICALGLIVVSLQGLVEGGNPELPVLDGASPTEARVQRVETLKSLC